MFDLAQHCSLVPFGSLAIGAKFFFAYTLFRKSGKALGRQVDGPALCAFMPEISVEPIEGLTFGELQPGDRFRFMGEEFEKTGQVATDANGHCRVLMSWTIVERL